jgi:hypothetical protein
MFRASRTPARPPPESMRAALESGGELPGLPGLDTLSLRRAWRRRDLGARSGLQGEGRLRRTDLHPVLRLASPAQLPAGLQAAVGIDRRPGPATREQPPPIRDEQRIYVLHGAVTRCWTSGWTASSRACRGARKPARRARREARRRDGAVADVRLERPGSFSTTDGVVRYWLGDDARCRRRELSTSTVPLGRGMEFKVSAEDVAPGERGSHDRSDHRDLERRTPARSTTASPMSPTTSRTIATSSSTNAFTARTITTPCARCSKVDGHGDPQQLELHRFHVGRLAPALVANLNSADQFLVVGSVDPHQK